MILTANQADILTEIMNLGMGRAANSLNQLVGAHIQLAVPFSILIAADEAQARIQSLGWESLSTVHLQFNGSLNGNAALVLDGDSAVKLVSLLTGDEGTHEDLDGLRQATLEEAGNILLNGVVGAVSNLLDNQISFSVPYHSDSDHVIERLTSKCGDAFVLLSRAQFRVAEHQIDGEILLYFEVRSLEVLLSALDRHFAVAGMAMAGIEPGK